MWRYLVFCFFIFIACDKNGLNNVTLADKDRNTLFKRLPNDETGIAFSNTVNITDDFDVFRYRNFYNGGGVAIGDINNDSLPDVYLTSNMGDNKLFLNKGNWQFEDITAKAGVKGSKIWSTGVSMVDVNADGWLDIYVCNAGDVKGGRRENELFINNGDLTFTEKAAAYGIADRGFSTHAAFFDFDKDGDLDCYVLNNSYRPVSTLGYRNLRHERDEFGGHKLYRNDNDRFIDISEQAGIYGSVIGFGLGVTVGDVNQDSWPDLYISNDFYERDYLYINNHDGTFREELEKHMGHISMFSMGADLADLNNDGYPEIFSTDMLPEDDYRLKTLTAFETYDVYQLRLKNGYHHQFMRNMLHINNRNGTFSEIGELAGVSATDWSWGALMADFNNDSFKEIFVCNGIYKDLINQDFVEYLGSSEQMRAAIEGKKINFKEFTDRMPSQKLSNYVFSRESDLLYKNVAEEWGLAEPSFSNGAAYGDIDNDGDLDLIVNNVNQEAFIYQNKSNELLSNNFLSLSFKGTGKNTYGLGTSVRVYINDQVLLYDHMPIRGFQSSMDYKMIVGLGGENVADSVVITWPDQKVQVLKQVRANAHILADYRNALPYQKSVKVPKKMLVPIKTDSIFHEENNFNDFDRDRLQYHMLSTQGPAFAKADLNNDGLDDFFVGGSVGHSAVMYLQKRDGSFMTFATEVFQQDAESEDVDAAFFDADGDGDLDLYVVTGGSEHTSQSIHTADRLYINEGLKNGAPEFKKSENRIPVSYQSGSCVQPGDVDNDGDLDLFVGTRVLPSYYGIPCDQLLLINDGKGNFSEQTQRIAPELKRLGMVTDAVWFDYDGNGFHDLLIAGEWMPVTLFLNDGHKLAKAHDVQGLSYTEGWWNRIREVDIDADGDLDFVLGNLGLNSKFKPSRSSPLSLYVGDFDENGSIEPVFAFLKDGTEYPVALRQDIIKQMSSLKKNFVFYKDYADKSITDIFSRDLLLRATKLNFYEPRTSLLINHGSRGFELQSLPVEAQFSPVYGIETTDVDGDGWSDIILAGNLFSVKPEVGRYDAMHALLLRNDGKGHFSPIPSTTSGLHVEGEVRHIAVLDHQNKKKIAFIRNNDSVIFYRFNQ